MRFVVAAAIFCATAKEHVVEVPSGGGAAALTELQIRRLSCSLVMGPKVPHFWS